LFAKKTTKFKTKKTQRVKIRLYRMIIS